MTTISKMKLLWIFLWAGTLSSFYFLTIEQFLIFLIFGHILGSIGQPVAIHRYFTHKSFKTNKFWHYFLMYVAVMVGTGSTIAYKAAHLKHHQFSDREGDPHSPKIMGFWKVFFGYFFAKEDNNMLYTRDLLRDKEHLFIHKYYFKMHTIYFILLLAINPVLVYPLYFLPACYSILGGAFVNAVAHWPDKPQTKWWITLLFADGHHEYHHENPKEWKIPFPMWTNTFIRMIKTN